MNFDRIEGYIIGKILINGTYTGRGSVELFEDDEDFKIINEYFQPLVDRKKIIRDRFRSNSKYKIRWVPIISSIKEILELKDDLEKIPSVGFGVLVALLNRQSKNKQTNKFYFYGDTYHSQIIQNLMLYMGLEFVPHPAPEYPGPSSPVVLNDDKNFFVRNAQIVDLSGVCDSVRLYRSNVSWLKFVSGNMGLNGGNLLSHPFLNDVARLRLVEFINVEFHPTIINQINQRTIELGGFPLKSLPVDPAPAIKVIEPSEVRVINNKNEFNQDFDKTKFWKNSDGNFVCKDCMQRFMTTPPTHLCQKDTQLLCQKEEVSKDYTNSDEIVVNNGVVAVVNNIPESKKHRSSTERMNTEETNDSKIESITDLGIRKRESIKAEREYLEQNVQIPPDNAIEELEINKKYMQKTYIGEALTEFREDAKKEKLYEGVDVVDIDPVKDIFIKHGKKWESEGITSNGRIIDRPRYERAYREYKKEKKERLDTLGITMEQYDKMADAWYQLETKTEK